MLLVFGVKVSSSTSLILVKSSSARFVRCPQSSRVCQAFFGFHWRMRSPVGQFGHNSEGFRGRCGSSLVVGAISV